MSTLVTQVRSDASVKPASGFFLFVFGSYLSVTIQKKNARRYAKAQLPRKRCKRGQRGWNPRPAAEESWRHDMHRFPYLSFVPSERSTQAQNSAEEVTNYSHHSTARSKGTRKVLCTVCAPGARSSTGHGSSHTVADYRSVSRSLRTKGTFPARSECRCLTG